MSNWNTEKWLEARGAVQEELMAAAMVERQRVYGNRVFVRAVVEVSNFCRENCGYCGMRRDNKSLTRYRMDLDLLKRIALEEMPDSVTDLNIQTGEDPVAVRDIVIPLVREVTRNTRMGVSVCLGTLSESLYEQLYEAGARYYIIKMETGNEEHYRQMQSPGTMQERMEAIHTLARSGWDVSSGFIMGLPGQTRAHVLETLDLLINRLPLAGCSVSPFIPGEGTPFQSDDVAGMENTMNALAIMRLMKPEWVIPAVSAMNLAKAGSYSDALRIGSNLATINLTPQEWRDNYQLYKKERFIMKEERVLKAVADAGCEVSTESLCRYLARTKASAESGVSLKGW